jgi:O-antigen ligase
MLKAIFYVGLAGVAIIATFINPFVGVIACIEAYLLNPAAISMDDGQFRYQFWTSVVFIASFLIHRPRPVPHVGKENWTLKFLWAFIAIAALSALWAIQSSDVALTAIYEVVKTVVMVSLFVRVIRTERQMTAVVFGCIAGVAHAAFMHVIGTRWGYVSTSLGREQGVLPDSQTGVMVLFVPIVLLLAMLGTRTQKILCWCALPFVLDSIVGTYERTGFTALVIEFVLIFICVPWRQKRQLIPAMVAGLGLLLFRFTPDDYWKKMATITKPHEEASANSRFVVNAASWRMFLDYPMGVGYRNYPYTSPQYLDQGYLTRAQDGQLVRSAHNSYFTILCETGVFGFAFWTMAFVGTIFLLRRVRKRAGTDMRPLEIYAAGFEIGLYGWAIAGWFQSYHEIDPAYWFIGLAVVLLRLQYQRENVDTDAVDDNVDLELQPPEHLTTVIEAVF